ncbi:CII family transcriptional regulator [Paraburkholderia sp. MM6662-R1]|uniref:CII family transcriptional regulator n=1 Tax=Paraburkholderia sp. MM6662-R1 TaxID=2991066 RepID=UPI003D1B8A3C
MSTEEVSPDEIENTRMLGARNETEILRAVARTTQARAADCLGVSASTISRTLEDLPRWSHLLAALGLQIAPLDSMVVDQTELTALESMSEKYLQMRRQQRLKGMPS